MPNKSESDRIAWKFLKTMGVEINITPLHVNIPFFNINNQKSFQNSVFNPNFSVRAAKELTEKMFTPSEQEKISELIEELSREEPSLIEKAYATTKQKTSELGSTTREVFNQLSGTAWKFFGLIEVKKEHFLKARSFFLQMLNDLGVRRGKRYQSSQIKEHFSEALNKLEELVKNKKTELKGKTSTNPLSEQNETNQTEKEKNNKEPNPPRSEKTDSENLLLPNKDKLFELVKKGEEIDNSEELRKIIEQIEGLRGEKNYESLKQEISTLKKKLANQNFEKYCSANREMIKKELKTEGIEENELDTEVQKKLQRLRKEEINQAEVETMKDEISNNIKLKGAQKKLEKLLKDYQNASRQKKEEVLKQIIAFINSSNSFYQKVYQQKKIEVDSLLKSIDSPQSSPTLPGYSQIIAGGIALVGITFIVIKSLKNRKRISAK